MAREEKGKKDKRYIGRKKPEQNAFRKRKGKK